MIIMDCPKEYTGNKTAGEIAKETNSAIGTIGCKHCGVTTHGRISRNCDWCGEDRFE